jgi:uncharacterized protein
MYHKPDLLLSIFNNISSINLLIDEKMIFNEIEIFGLDYSNDKFYLKNNLNNLNINDSKFSILIYHVPTGIEYGINKFDLMLLGHTHGGQIFPLTLIIDLIYKYGRGYYEEENSIIYTTNGAGLFGPKMRLGSQNEIVLFTLMP